MGGRGGSGRGGRLPGVRTSGGGRARHRRLTAETGTAGRTAGRKGTITAARTMAASRRDQAAPRSGRRTPGIKLSANGLPRCAARWPRSCRGSRPAPPCGCSWLVISIAYSPSMKNCAVRSASASGYTSPRSRASSTARTTSGHHGVLGPLVGAGQHLRPLGTRSAARASHGTASCPPAAPSGPSAGRPRPARRPGHAARARNFASWAASRASSCRSSSARTCSLVGKWK